MGVALNLVPYAVMAHVTMAPTVLVRTLPAKLLVMMMATVLAEISAQVVANASAMHVYVREAIAAPIVMSHPHAVTRCATPQKTAAHVRRIVVCVKTHAAMAPVNQASARHVQAAKLIVERVAVVMACVQIARTVRRVHKTVVNVLRAEIRYARYSLRVHTSHVIKLNHA